MQKVRRDISSLIKKIKLINWIKRIEREHYLFSVFELGKAYSYNLKNLGIKAQKYTLIIAKGSLYTIFRA